MTSHVLRDESDVQLMRDLVQRLAGELCAFCICGFTDSSRQVGYTDPIGTHARYKRLGLGKAIVTAGLQALKNRGARMAELGTSSENLAMRRLAETLGFVLVSESLWFSRTVA